MKIGLFSDVYEPSLNGVVYVVNSLKKWLEEMGHQVFIFCPGESIAPKLSERKKSGLSISEFNDFLKSTPKDGIYKIPSVKGMLFDDFRVPLFNPARLLKKIKNLNLDIIHFVTPGQMGIMAVYTSKKLNIPIVAQHCTDVYEYVEYYKKSVPVAYLAGILVPFITDLSKTEAKDLAKSYLPKLESPLKISKELIGKILGIVYDACDVCLCVSKKSKLQLQQFSYGNGVFKVCPTGVDAFPPINPADVQAFKDKYNIKSGDKVIMYCGRISAEKNLPLLISVLEKINQEHDNIKLMFVGDFDYRPVLESIAAGSPAFKNILFTGRIDHAKLGVAYQSCDIFAFPSMTDTQGLVLTEAAHLGLPLVIIDKDVTEVVIDGQNGFISDGSVQDFADKIMEILGNTELYKRFSDNSKTIAAKFTEKKQTQKVVRIYNNILKSHV